MVMTSLRPIPVPVKLAYTAFMAVLIPVYWYFYGPTNFLYFCDLALILTLIGVWIDSPLLVSMCAVGIILPRFRRQFSRRPHHRHDELHVLVIAPVSAGPVALPRLAAVPADLSRLAHGL
jgi:hypothetical protein